MGGAVCVRGGGREGTRGGSDGMHGARLKAWRPGHARGAHVEHVAHGRDAGGVEAQRLVEGRRVLPNQKAQPHAMQGEVQTGLGGWACGAVAAQAACTGKARLRAPSHRARAERTANMSLMSVTLEVSKLSGWLKADASCRVEGRACDAGGERCEAGGGRACGVVAANKRHMHGERPDARLGGQGHARERTWNM